MPVGLLVLQASNGVPVFTLTAGPLRCKCASVIAQHFWETLQAIKAGDFEHGPRHRGVSFHTGKVVVMGRYRASYSLVGDAYAVVLTHVNDSPFAGDSALDHARKLLGSFSSTGVSRVKGAQYVELHYALGRVLSGASGVEVIGQKELMPYTTPAAGEKLPEVGASAWEQKVNVMKENDRNVMDVFTAPISVPEDYFVNDMGETCGNTVPQRDVLLSGKSADEELVLTAFRVTAGSNRMRKSVDNRGNSPATSSPHPAVRIGTLPRNSGPEALQPVTTPGRKRSQSTDRGDRPPAHALVAEVPLRKIGSGTAGRLRKSRTGLTAVFTGPPPPQ